MVLPSTDGTVTEDANYLSKQHTMQNLTCARIMGGVLINAVNGDQVVLMRYCLSGHLNIVMEGTSCGDV